MISSTFLERFLILLEFIFPVPQVEVIGGPEKHVKVGSTARLECRVSSAVQLPDYIFWYHMGERVLDYNNPRLNINVARVGEQEGVMSLTSTLVIRTAKVEDAGNYSCIPSNLDGAFATLHILDGGFISILFVLYVKQMHFLQHKCALSQAVY